MMRDYVKEAFKQGTCAIGRFWGQTFFFVPPKIVKKLGKNRLTELVSQEFLLLKEFGNMPQECGREGLLYVFESVLNADAFGNQEYEGIPKETVHPNYHKPERLNQKILEEYKRK